MAPSLASFLQLRSRNSLTGRLQNLTSSITGECSKKSHFAEAFTGLRLKTGKGWVLAIRQAWTLRDRSDTVGLSTAMKRTHRNLRHLLTLIICARVALDCAVAAKSDAANPGSRKSPDWLRRSVVYEIFPRNFSNEGTFNAITERLDDLKDLGVNILWLMPIHPIGQKMKKGSIGSPFAVRDFYAVNPDYGTTNGFKRLVTEAHNRKMKV